MGVELEAVTVEHHKSDLPKKIRISKRVKRALDLMAFQSLNRPQAAQEAGITDHALYCAMKKPHVKSYMQELMRVLREGEAFRSPGRIAQLADSAESESVRLQANQYLINLNGEGPDQHSSALINNVNLPGLTIVYNEQTSSKPTAPAVIEGKAEDVTYTPAKHPALSDD